MQLTIEFEKSMRKASDEEDEFYDRTLIHVEDDKEEQQKYREKAKSQNYTELKNILDSLLEERQEINEFFIRPLVTPKLLSDGRVQTSTVPQELSQKDKDEDELDRLMIENDIQLNADQKARNVARMKVLVEEIDEQIQCKNQVKKTFKICTAKFQF